uniref:HPP family protein n=1 Tax=Candidatus Kentrum eta TaxID=2126337 RepID=A0A450UHG0_9GAMM|nr:MAG: HPP family protein [Candidatus Kentron sp. H]VFJ91957.1 MAG: HPP family protein [Candidatus Kentron sp. H]VFJ98807.1 MAG: HPP family protein [Candidatus Kentron sp. H]
MCEQQTPVGEPGKRRLCDRVASGLGRLFTRGNRRGPPRREERPFGQGSAFTRYLIKHRYLFESSLVGWSIALLLFLAYCALPFFPGKVDFPSGIVAASLASSAFLVFVLPGLETAKVRRLLCGHLIASTVGCLCYYLMMSAIGHGVAAWYTVVVSGSVAVGLSAFLMVIVGAQHPPAAGTALGFAIAVGPFSHLWPKLVFVVAGVLLLGVMSWAFARLPEALHGDLW